MISDVLFDANNEIERYLNDPLYSSIYSDENLRNQLKALATEMDKIRAYLDTPPIIEAVYESLVDDIKKRCEKASTTCKETILENKSIRLEIFLPQNQEKKSFFVSNIENAKGLLDFPFESYNFLPSYNAISSNEDIYVDQNGDQHERGTTQQMQCILDQAQYFVDLLHGWLLPSRCPDKRAEDGCSRTPVMCRA